MACACCPSEEKHSFFNTTKWKVISLSISLASLVLSFFWLNIVGHEGILVYFNPAYVAIVLCGYPLFKSAFVNLFKHKKISASLLISTAIVATIALEVIGYFYSGNIHGHGDNYLFAAGEIAFLMMIGELIEAYTVAKSRSGITKLISLKPSTVRVKLGEEYVELDAEFVEVGDTVLVKPNERISVDGVILSGSTAVDMSSITGESLPVDRTQGDTVFAGTFNTNGAIYISVTRRSDETTVSKMIHMVEEAENNKAPIARIADRWSTYIVPSAILLSVVVFFFTKFVLNVEWMDATVRAVTILVTFCPCALALATPTAVAAGIGNASYRGVLIKSGSALEALAKVDTIAFDKTGTLTTGLLNVASIVTEGMDESQFMKFVGSAELNSEHPIAQSLVKRAKLITSLAIATETNSLVGVGVQAVIEGKKVVVAKWEHFAKTNKNVKFSKFASEQMEKGCTVIAASIDDVLYGAISLSDTVRDNANSSISALHEIGLRTIMLTGDNKLAAQEVANIVGVSEVRYQLMPSDKVGAVNDMKSGGHNVCMVGDGVNDAPSLAAADCSIAMGAMGNDVALEVADIALMTSDVSKISGLTKLARKVLFTIKRNIAISMVINVIAVVISTMGILDPVGGALLHNASSIFVVLNSSLLLLAKDIK